MKVAFMFNIIVFNFEAFIRTGVTFELEEFG